MDDQDEPLEQWAARRQQSLRPIGTKKIEPVLGGATHVNPREPRLILEWNGFQWVPVTVAENHAAACRLVYPPPKIDTAQPERKTRVGRHRKP
ncbi:DUF6087 family protein [Kitasatospora sp. NPDC052896]|uniref:DUF6087 family protein n=1 Tax=Kitasatospora sp. NPDC052896 TaxID=3364061 RepID=UPI0037C6E78F